LTHAEILTVISYRIETSCAHNGAYQYTEVVHTKDALVEHCTAEWRNQSVHVVYALQVGIPPRMFAVYVAGRCVSPLLNDLYR
jgi:hypothetical protein